MKKEDEVITQNTKSANFNSYPLLLFFLYKEKKIYPSKYPPPQQKHLTINF